MGDLAEGHVGEDLAPAGGGHLHNGRLPRYHATHTGDGVAREWPRARERKQKQAEAERGPH